MKINNFALLTLIAMAATGGYQTAKRNDQQLHAHLSSICMDVGSTRREMRYMEGDIREVNKSLRVDYLDFLAGDLKQKIFDLRESENRNCGN